MKIAPLADVKTRLSAYLEACRTEGPVIVTRNGRAVAVIIAPSDEDDLERLVLSRSPRFRGLLEKSRESMRRGKGLSADDFWRAAREGRGKRGKPRLGT